MLADGFSLEFKSPGLFSVYGLILIMLSFGWSQILLFPSPPVPFTIVC